MFRLAIASIEPGELPGSIGEELAHVEVQPRQVRRRPPAPAGPAGDLGDRRFGRTGRPPQSEAAFVVGLVEWRQAVERRHIGGEAPEQRAETTGTTETVESPPGVGRRR